MIRPISDPTRCYDAPRGFAKYFDVIISAANLGNKSCVPRGFVVENYVRRQSGDSLCRHRLPAMFDFQ
jgi:hypothetical protein